MITMESSSLGHKNTKLHAIPATIKQTPHSVISWVTWLFSSDAPRGGGGTPIMAHTGKFRPRGVPFSPFFTFLFSYDFHKAHPYAIALIGPLKTPYKVMAQGLQPES